MLLTVHTLDDLRAATDRLGGSGTIALVPTMGALHDGHLSLVAAAKQRADRGIVTIFVNPKQFNNPDDLKNYPRTEEEDARKLERFGVDAIWAPEGDIMYPPGFSTNVSVAGLTDVEEAARARARGRSGPTGRPKLPLVVRSSGRQAPVSPPGW